MANIKKNFNFRNGVQVDDDNLLVTSTGLVGIGTTVPTEALDVRGAVKIIGDANISSATIGIVTITEVAPNQIIGAGVSIKSGIVTAQGTGIVTFYGDARFLQGMPTSQWEDTNAGLGVSSIYNTGGTVGIATTNPQFTLQIGENPNQIGGVSGDGVGISSVGDIKASGIITATGFVGNITGNVTGNVTGNLTGVAASTTQLQTARTIGGVEFDGTSDINLPGVNTAGNQNTSGTASNLSGTPNILVNNLNVAGVSTFVGITSFFDDIFFPQQRKGATGFERLNSIVYDKSDASLNFNGFAYATFGADDPFGRKLRLFSTTSSAPAPTAGSFTIIRALHTNLGIQCGVTSEITLGSQSGDTIIRVSPASGIATIRNADIPEQLTTLNANVSGIVTAAELNSPLIGVGTDTPANDIQIRKNANVEIQVTSDTGSAGLTVGRESGTNNTNNAEFRYGLVSGGAPYSSAQSLDILNYGTGNFNYHLSANNPSGVNGDFHWHKGLNTRLMTLTGIGGSLGIGVTTPSTKFEVVGNSKFSGSVEITNNLTLSGSLNISAVNANLTGNVTGNLFGLIDTPVSGISTINHLRVGQGLGIGVTDAGNKFNLGSTPDNRIFINNNSQIGIKTDTISDPNVVVEIIGNVRLKKAVSVGNTTRSAVDFSDAVNITNEGETGLPFNRSQLAYMIPPRVTTAQRNLLRDAYTNSATLLSGAMVYNTSINKLQVWNGSAWETVTSS